MTYEQITTLLDRGFTPDQITLLTTSSVNPAAANPTQAAAVPPKAEEISTESVEEESVPLDPSSTDSPGEETPSGEDTNSEVLAAIADLKKTVQANNIKTMSVEGVNPDAELEKAMSELIRPSFEKGE